MRIIEPQKINWKNWKLEDSVVINPLKSRNTMRYDVSKSLFPRCWASKMGQKASKSALKSLKKHAKSRSFDAFSPLCCYLSRSEFLSQNLNRKGHFSETPYQSQRNGISITTKRRLNHIEMPSLIAWNETPARTCICRLRRQVDLY